MFAVGSLDLQFEFLEAGIVSAWSLVVGEFIIGRFIF
jgi:hypothetical protein